MNSLEMLNKKFILKFLLDSCAAVNVGPMDVLKGSNIVMEESDCMIIAANGSILKADGKLRFHFDSLRFPCNSLEFETYTRTDRRALLLNI